MVPNHRIVGHCDLMNAGNANCQPPNATMESSCESYHRSVHLGGHKEDWTSDSTILSTCKALTHASQETIGLGKQAFLEVSYVMKLLVGSVLNSWTENQAELQIPLIVVFRTPFHPKGQPNAISSEVHP